MKITGSKLMVLAIGLVATLAAVYFVVDGYSAQGTTEQTTPAAKVQICPYYYDSFESRTVAHLIQFGNFAPKTLNITDHYTRPTPGKVELAGKAVHSDSKVIELAEPYLTGAKIDSVFNIRREKNECYFVKQ